MISLNNISKTYRTSEVETTALDQINLQIREGEFVSIMGTSGCGKTTLLNILGMLDTASEGSYLFNGEDVTHYTEKQRTNVRKKNIGFIFQSFNLIDELTVYENIELPLYYLGLTKSERKKRVLAVMEKVGISHRANHFPKQLSGGQQQRTAVCRAVVTQPKLILADEPTGNLDSHFGNEVLDILRGLNEMGTTIIMVTHSKHDASYSQRIIELKDGAILTQGNLPVNSL